MNAVALSHTLAGRFAWFFQGLCRVIGVDAQRRGMEAALAWAVWHRVRVLGERFNMLIVRARAGRLRARRKAAAHPDAADQVDGQACPQGESTPHPTPLPQGEREKKAAGPLLPREFGWVRRALPETGQFAGVLTYLLRDPETAALVEKAPEAGRILRPLCRLLGIEAPEFLRRGYVPADPPPHLTSPPPRAERNDCGDAGSAEASVAAEPALPVEAPVAAETPAPASPPPTERPASYYQRPGGLYWNGKRTVWS
jgi:hypothetical protein